MILRVLVLAGVAVAFVGCDWMPGKPKPADAWKPASAITDFTTLYRQNCIGCHGMGKVVSGSIGMDNPTYLAVVPREVLAEVISQGVPGTGMPGFSAAAGGTLTGDQIEILVNGLLAKKPASPPSDLPVYAAALGDVVRGGGVFAESCASCHGAKGQGGDTAGSVVNPAYLDLVSNQYLRTISIAGRPELGCPDFASRTPGKAMTNQDVADVAAWLAAQRKNEFGRPVTPSAPAQP